MPDQDWLWLFPVVREDDMSANLLRKLIADARAAGTPENFEAVRQAGLAAERSGELTEDDFGNIMRAV
jgi:hypothetical protein